MSFRFERIGATRIAGINGIGAGHGSVAGLCPGRMAAWWTGADGSVNHMSKSGKHLANDGLIMLFGQHCGCPVKS